MKKYFLISAILIFLVFFIPWLSGDDSPRALETEDPEPQQQEIPQESGVNEEGKPPEPETISTGERDSAMRITVLMDGTVVEMDLGTYLVGVVRAEMPASFELEALKAQAVAARTYTLHKILGGGSENHPDADTCTDINCCKAYMDAVSAAALWGVAAAEYEEKIRTAVSATDGEYVL